MFGKFPVRKDLFLMRKLSIKKAYEIWVACVHVASGMTMIAPNTLAIATTFFTDQIKLLTGLKALPHGTYP